MSSDEAAQLEPDQADPIQALARAVCRLVAETGGTPAPDALRARVGEHDALLVCALAGMDVDQIQSRWAAAVPAAARREQPDLFAADPRHDPRYVAAATGGGSVTEALRAIALDPDVPALLSQRAEIALSHIARGESVGDALDAAEIQLAKARLARQGDQPAPLGIPVPAGQAPQQRSAVHSSVSALGSEMEV